MRSGERRLKAREGEFANLFDSCLHLLTLVQGSVLYEMEYRGSTRLRYAPTISHSLSFTLHCPTAPLSPLSFASPVTYSPPGRQSTERVSFPLLLPPSSLSSFSLPLDCVWNVYFSSIILNKQSREYTGT